MEKKKETVITFNFPPHKVVEVVRAWSKEIQGKEDVPIERQKIMEDVVTLVEVGASVLKIIPEPNDNK